MPALRGKYGAVLTLVTVVVALAVSPTFAQTDMQSTFSLRYWGTGLTFRGPGTFGTNVSDPGRAWGLSFRGDMRTSPWSFSLNYDSLSITPTSLVWGSGTLFDANVHYRFGTNLNSYAGAFVGFGKVSVTDTVAAGVNNADAAGVRIGMEYLMRLPTGWVFTASAAWGPWSTNLPGIAVTTSGRVTDYKIAVGNERANGFGAELGWRAFNWNIQPSGGACSPDCNFAFSGVVLAFTYRSRRRLQRKTSSLGGHRRRARGRPRPSVLFVSR